MIDDGQPKRDSSWPSVPFPPPALWWLLAGSLFVHLFFMPAPGWEADVARNGAWMRAGVESGFAHAEEKVRAIGPIGPYPPGYLYLLTASAGLWGLFSGGAVPDNGTLAMLFVVKLPHALADLGGALLLYLLAASYVDRRRALLVAAGYAYNPAMIYDSAVWGQADSLLPFFVLPAAWAVCRRRPTLGFALAMSALLVKLQAVIFVPVLGLVALQVCGAAATIRALGTAALIPLVCFLPFFAAHVMEDQIKWYLGASGLYPFISMNAYNVWWLVGGISSPDIPDMLRVGNAMLTYHALGSIMLGTATSLILWRLWRVLARPDGDKLPAVVEACALQAMAFYLFPTQMHERYIVLALLFLAAICIWRPRAWWLYGSCSAAVLVSLASTLNRVYASNAEYPGLRWLSFFIRSDHGETFALSVFFLASFAVLLLWTSDRRFQWIAPSAAILVGVATMGLAHAPFGRAEMLSEWQPVKQSQGWGAMRNNRSVGDKRLSVSGAIFRRGIGTHANSQLTYHLNGAFQMLDTIFGVDDEANIGQKIRFRVLADSEVRFDSGDLAGMAAPRHVAVSVAGAQYLTLEVLDGGDGINYDHADWLEPQLLR